MPHIDTDAVKYWGMVTFTMEDDRLHYLDCAKGWRLVCEPPYTRNRDIEQYLAAPLRTDHHCHTQAVERGVSLTSDVTHEVSGHLDQVGEALVITAARKLLPGRLTVKRHKEVLDNFFGKLSDGGNLFRLLDDL